MRKDNPLVLLGLFLSIAVSSTKISALDLSFGGIVDSSIARSLSSAGSFAWFSFSPLASVEDALGESLTLELRLAPQVNANTDPAQVTLSPGQSRLRLSFGNGVIIDLGWMKDEPRAAELFPQSVFYGPSDPLSRFETGGGATLRETEPMIEAKFAGDWWRLSAYLAPWMPPLVLSHLDSPWFPSTLVPASVTIAAQTYQRRQLIYDASVSSSNDWVFDPSWSLSAGVSLGNLDFDAYYFEGQERNAILYGDVILGTGVGYSFDVSLVPERRFVRETAASATLATGAFRFWEESSWTWGASFPTGSVASPFLNPGWYYLPGSTLVFTQIAPVISVNRLGLTFGSSWNPDIPGLAFALFAEGTANTYFGSPNGAKPPILSNAIGGGISASDQMGRFGFELGFLASLSDWSYAVRPSLHIGFGSDRDLEFAFPLFVGAADSALGQFSAMRYITATFSQRF